MTEKAEVLGAAELARVFKELPDALSRNVVDAVARAGAVELRSAALARLALDMRARSPREDDVIIVKRRVGNKDRIEGTFDVGPPRRKPWLRWLHDGTAPHLITVKDIDNPHSQSALASRRLRKIFGKSVDHPGQVARPWLFSAWYEARDRVYAVMARKMAPALAKQAKKLNTFKYTKSVLSKFV